MLEYEKKVLLTKEEYDVLAEKCRGMPLATQINYYFDTDDSSMNRKGITCRIRAKNGKYKTTIKKHCTENPSCSIEVDLCETTEINTKVFDALGLHFQGELITSRIYIHKDAFCEMVLDRNTYLGHTDFEIEIEYRKECEERALRLLKDAAECLVATKLVVSTEEFLIRINNAKSKSKRFFERGKCNP